MSHATNLPQPSAAAPVKQRRSLGTYMIAAVLLGSVVAVIATLKPSGGDAHFISASDRARNADVRRSAGGLSPIASESTLPPAPPDSSPNPQPTSPPTVASATGEGARYADNTPGPQPACLTPTPAAPGTAFPCTTRVTKYNSHTFWAWTAEEELRKASLLSPIVSQCAGIEAMGRTPQERPTTSLRVVGCSGYSGTWTRCWIVSMTNSTSADGSVVVPTCKAGDHFDVRIQSATSKVAIDRVIDLDNGIYEMQFYIRKRSDAYLITIDKMMLHQVMPINDVRMTLGKDSVVGFEKTAKWSARRPPGVAVTPTPHWPDHTESFLANYSLGVDVVPLPQRCDEVYDKDRFRFGAWMHLGECDNVHCVGKLTGRPSLEGWLWASDVCQMKMHTSAELAELLASAWVLGWGGSTMKQPLSNFMEYYLVKPIFGVFMNQLDTLKRKRKRPGFFSYRMWDATPFPTTRISMQWGGCPGLMHGPSQCGAEIGIAGWSRVQSYIEATIKEPRNETPSFPTALLMDMTLWRYPMDDDVQYLSLVDGLFKQIDSFITATKRPRPMLVWHTTPTGGNSKRGSRPAMTPMGFTQRSFDWQHEDHMMALHASTRRLIHVSRHIITLPLHFGIDWVHFGVHYGASEGMCNTGHNRKGYEFAYCLAKTWGDDAVIIAWLNALAEHRRYLKGS